MFIVRVSEARWDDYRESNLFVTSDEKVAKKYVEKFNRILKSCTEFYDNAVSESQLNDKNYSQRLLDDGLTNKEVVYQERLEKFLEVGECFYEPIEVR